METKAKRPADLRLGADDIRRLRELTDRPFGVNLWLHPDLQTVVTI